MTLSQNFSEICDYFDQKLKTYGPTPKGADWNSDVSQNLRFNQLLKIVANPKEDFSLLDYLQETNETDSLLTTSGGLSNHQLDECWRPL